MRRRGVWAVAAPAWLGVCLTVLVPYAAAPPVWLPTGLVAATAALVVRRTRWLALVAPVTGVFARSADASLSSQMLGIAGLFATVVAVAVLDGWDLSAPSRRRSAMVRLGATGIWTRERVLSLLPAIAASLAVALAWVALSMHRWDVGPWPVVLAPALLTCAVAAATYELWWRPRSRGTPTRHER